MLGAIAKTLFGSENDRILKQLGKRVIAINALEPQYEKFTDDELAGRTRWFRERLNSGEALDNILEEAFATVREAAKRTLRQRHFDVQLLGGMVLHDGKIAEMKTGEGKTLVATLAVYLNALPGLGVHVVTVNDYLARRDADWMGSIYRFLGMSVGVIVHGLTDAERKAAYNCDITYGTNNEFGFDYLRDNMKYQLDEMCQRDFNFAIVDEVDSILVDEARTPLIISGPADDSSELYRSIDAVIPSLTTDDYEVDEKQRSATFTEQGTEHLEQLLIEIGILKGGSLYDIENISIVHHVNQALRAHKMFARDVDYLVRNDQVVIIDEFTGRAMEGRRYSDGLHQAIEAREGVTIQNENQTLASITFQNYFRQYPKLAGMTGTAMTEAGEFAEIYKLDVVEIPTNVAVNRTDHDDEVYRTQQEKWDAIIDLIEDCRTRGQPTLVGTVSIEKSELLSGLLRKRNVPHQVLNARFHEQEAMIIAQAGEPGTVTIATNMAGRGTDIQLGGNPDMRIQMEAPDGDPERETAIRSEVEARKADVVSAGGLYVIGTERHESRRIDNQLRGRSGRQGDPGSSSFFLSLEDDLMRIFGSERMDGMLKKLGLEEGEAIVHPWINKALEKAQQKVEARNFEIRKQLLKYDDVMNDQRRVIFEQRKEIMRAPDVHSTVVDMRAQVIDDMVARNIPENAYSEQWDVETLARESVGTLGISAPVAAWAAEEGIADQEIRERLSEQSNRHMAEKAANVGSDAMRTAEKNLLLHLLDQQWKEHLLALDHLRQGINLRAYAQRDPLNEYKREAFNLFEAMLANLRQVVTSVLSHLVFEPAIMREEAEVRTAARRTRRGQQPARPEPASADPDGPGADATSPQPARPIRNRQGAGLDPLDPTSWGKVPRNAPCPCGSGKKYKHCHGNLV